MKEEEFHHLYKADCECNHYGTTVIDGLPACGHCWQPYKETAEVVYREGDIHRTIVRNDGENEADLQERITVERYAIRAQLLKAAQ